MRTRPGRRARDQPCGAGGAPKTFVLGGEARPRSSQCRPATRRRRRALRRRGRRRRRSRARPGRTVERFLPRRTSGRKRRVGDCRPVARNGSAHSVHDGPLIGVEQRGQDQGRTERPRPSRRRPTAARPRAERQDVRDCARGETEPPSKQRRHTIARLAPPQRRPRRRIPPMTSPPLECVRSAGAAPQREPALPL